ncbi:MAG: hypothetical protein ACI4AB_03585 [Acetatifactor sp.]
MRRNTKRQVLWIGLLLLVLGTVTLLYWGNQKQVWFCDEIYTYESANGFEQDWPAEHTGEWMTGADVESFFAADSATLSLNDITIRLYSDHVPLYFWLFRILSFYVFKGSGTIWIGLSLNLVFYLLFLALVYGSFCRLTGKPVISGVCVVLSCIVNRLVLEQATTLRMYMMLLLAEGLLLLGGFWILRNAEREKMSFGVFAYLLAVSLFGFLTHYDFWIFYAVTAACFCLWLLLVAVGKQRKGQERFWISREFRYVLAWTGNFAVSIFVTTWIFPYCKWNLNRGKGEMALHSVFDFSGEKLQQIGWGYQRLSASVFGEKIPAAAGLAVMFCCIAGGAVILYRKKEVKKLTGLLLTVLIAQLYQLVVCFTLPDAWEERYLWGTFTFMMLCMVWGAVLLGQFIFSKIRNDRTRKICQIALPTVLVICTLGGEAAVIEGGKGIAYLLQPEKDMSALEECSGIPWLVYGPTVGVYSYYDWIIPERICFLTSENTPEDAAAVHGLEGESSFVLYSYEDLCEQAIGFFEQELGKTITVEYLTKSTNLTVYLVNLEN